MRPFSRRSQGRQRPRPTLDGSVPSASIQRRSQGPEATSQRPRRSTDVRPRRSSNASSTSSSSSSSSSSESCQSFNKKFMILPLRLRGIDFENPACPICQEDYEIGCTVAYLPCGHLFHSQCANGWLKHSTVCCMCRYELPAVQQQQQQEQQESDITSKLSRGNYCPQDDDIEYFNRHFQTRLVKNSMEKEIHIDNPFASTIKATFRL